MLKTTFLFLLITFLLQPTSLIAQLSVPKKGWTADNGNGTFKNPFLWGDWPDPDVIRVGDYFYFVSTSMHYVPGCPILRSKDLVNWEMAGYTVDKYDEDPRYNLQGGNMYLRGSWAATIRHHNGLFYVGFCTPSWDKEKGQFSICTAKDVKGPWTRTIFPEYLYDPGLFFDDNGKVYVAHGQGTLYLTELAANACSTVGKPVKIWDKAFHDYATFGKRFGMEGAHMYKIGGKYYITCPAGGTEGWQVCLRADNIYGPYEHKVIVNDDSSYPGNGLHQGGMVQVKDGSWWFIIMQDRGPIGRVPHLVPVKWVDGWPMLGEEGTGKGVVVCKNPNVGKFSSIKVPATSDEFNSKTLGLQWQWNHNPDNKKWSLKERKGYMRLHASFAKDLTYARNTLTQRVLGPSSEGTVEIEVSGLQDGNMAGFGIFEFPYAYIAVQKVGDTKRLLMVNNGIVIDSIGNFTPTKIWVSANATHVGFKATFSYSVDGTNFIPFGNELKMGLGLTWTANRFALFNYSTKEEGVGGYADFNWFHFKGENAMPNPETKEIKPVISSNRMLNPICPPGVYIADPEVRQMPDGRVYLYGSRDEPGNAWCSRSYNVLSSSDLTNWNIEQVSFATSGIGKQTYYTDRILYAPDCIHHNGKYYLYYCLEGDGKDEGVALSSSPYGPFKNGKIIEGINGIDPSVFIDDDGQAYLFWGQANAKGAKLSKDMLSVEGEIHDKLLTYKEHAFNEGSSVRKRNGIYYYVYPGHQRHGESNCATLNYATATSPLGPYTYRGVIIDNWGSGKNLVNNHGSIAEINGQWYIFYHRPTHGTSSMRKACMEPITFNADGTINEVEMTTQGAGGLICPLQRMDAARACLMSGNVMVTVRRPDNDIPVEYLSAIRDGDHAFWKYFDFTGKEVNHFVCKTWGKNLAGKIEIRLDRPDGELIGTCNLAPIQGEVAYSINEANIKSVSGIHALVLAFKANKPEDKNLDLMNLEWFSFD